MEGIAAGVMRRFTILLICACCIAVALLQEPVCAAGFQVPDNLHATGLEFSPEGIISASGGVEFVITSLVEGTTVVVTADDIEYDTVSGVAELWGEVLIRLEEFNLEVACDHFLYDPLMERLEVEGVRLSLPLSSFVEEGRLPDELKLTTTGHHLYNFVPESVYLAGGSMYLDMSSNGGSFVMHDVTLCHHPRPDPDLFIKAREVRILGDSKVSIRDMSLRVSGVEVLSWPRLTRSTTPEPRMFSFDFPEFRFDKEGVVWQQRGKLDLEPFKTDLMLDMSTEYGILGHAFSYTEPSPNSLLGIEYGTRNLRDIDREKIERRDNYNLVYRQSFKGLNAAVNQIDIDLEYGEVAATIRDVPADASTERTAKDTRSHASSSLDFVPIRLTKDFYLVTGCMASYTDYNDANEYYQTLGGKIGVVWRTPGFDHFVQYKANDITYTDGANGEPVMAFDRIREQELNFATSIRLHPEWRHVIRGIYDLDGGEFDQFQIGAMKRQKTYEIGLYLDIPRESVGLEIGLLMD